VTKTVTHRSGAVRSPRWTPTDRLRLRSPRRSPLNKVRCGSTVRSTAALGSGQRILGDSPSAFSGKGFGL
ncbi:Hypothetical predicted protein, partial [Pelobates cultripes]